jgi:hypothetical protein
MTMDIFAQKQTGYIVLAGKVLYLMKTTSRTSCEIVFPTF